MTNEERYAAIRVELDAGHPDTGAYDADDAVARDEMSLANRTVNKNTTPEEAADATDGSEFNSVALSDAQRQMWISVLSWTTINLNAGIGLETASGMWNQGNTPLTKAALIATRKQDVGRNTELGFGAITIGDIQNARAL